MYKRVYSILAILTFLQAILWAKEIKYPVGTIPDSLKVNAKAVIRYREELFEIKSVGSGNVTVTYAVTILNENGLDYAEFSQYYSQKLEKIHSIKGTVYNSLGEKIESLTSDKLIDQSAISSEYSLFEDERVKLFQPKTLTYPFTVEYSYVIEYNGLLSLPEWQPIDDYNVSVESSKFKMICPNSLSFRYLEKNITNKAEIVQNDMTTSYEWKVENMVALVEQPFSASFSDFCPTVINAPNDFEIEGYKGNLSSWQNFGKWIAKLNEGRSELSAETKAQLLEKVKDCTSDYDKAKLIYEHLQHKTRYLNVTIGIGGWQPIPAETVDRLGYGDCKALSNYAKSLLDAVGVKSYYTLVRAGKNVAETQVNFPNSQFNHVILCLPLAKDTLWLECTNQNLPFGYTGSFTDDRFALVITETGGELIRTRSYSALENRLERNSIIRLDESGNATLITSALHSGVLYDDKIGLYLAGTEDRKKMILDEVDLPGAVLKKFDYQDIRAEVPSIKENIEIDIPRYGTLSGTRMLVSLVALDRQREVPKKVSSRKSNVVIRRAEVFLDSITIMIPEGYLAESVPGEIKTESRFGSYSLKPIAKENKIVCIRKLEINKGQYSPAYYAELIEFYKKIAVADNTKISLRKERV